MLSPVSGCNLVFFAAWLLADCRWWDQLLRYWNLISNDETFFNTREEQGSLIGALNPALHSSLWQSVSLIPACHRVWMNVVLIYWWWVWESESGKKSGATAEKRTFSEDRITMKCFITSKFDDSSVLLILPDGSRKHNHPFMIQIKAWIIYLWQNLSFQQHRFVVLHQILAVLKGQFTLKSYL